MNTKTELNVENYELVGIEKREGVFETEGRGIPYTTYVVKFKQTESPLIMTAKVDKIFRDYVEGEDE